MWNGTTLALNASPARRKTSPNSKPVEPLPSAAKAEAIPVKLIVPVKP